MLKKPAPIDETLIDSIVDDLEFFSRGVMLYFERGQLFQVDNVSTHTPATNTEEPGYYARLHPKYDPTNLEPQNIFRAGQSTNPHEIDFRSMKDSPCNLYFLMLNNTLKPQWLLGLPTNFVIYNTVNKSSQFIKAKSLSIKGKELIINSDSKDIKYPLAAEDSSSLSQVVDLLRDAISNNNNRTFKLLFQSFVCAGSYPPIEDQMISFYRSIVENLQFLFLFSMIEKSSGAELVSAWMEAAGHNIITLIPLALYRYFRVLSDPNLVFRSNSFLSALLVKVLEKDPGYIDFLDSIDMQADDLSEEFFTKFEQTTFQPLSQFLLHHVYVEARRAFPTQSTEYHGISGLLFLRIMTPRLTIKYPSMSMRLSALTPLYNMTESKVGIEKVKRMKDMLDQFEAFPDEFGIEKTPSTSKENIKLLIDFVAENSSKFLNIAQTTDVIQITNSYYQATTGKVPEVDNRPPMRIREENSENDSYSSLNMELSATSSTEMSNDMI